MGNTIGFQHEHDKLSEIVTNIITSDDTFVNKNYNFLSQDICQKYQFIFEEDLKKHLKINIATLGKSVYLVPHNKDSSTKAQICQKITNHYMRILYLLTLIKYVYNLEKTSISLNDIIFKNIEVESNILKIKYCRQPHKDYNSKNNFKIDFKQMHGLYFFTKYVLEPKEARAFVSVMRSILGRHNKSISKDAYCSNTELASVFKSKYNEKLSCAGIVKPLDDSKLPSLYIQIAANNPIFSMKFCHSPQHLLIDKNKNPNIVKLYELLQQNYHDNLKKMNTLLDMLVNKQGDLYTLKDINKDTLNKITEDVKLTIQLFFTQSLVDYQKLLDAAHKAPHIIS